jgi:hypothetical protein
MPAPTTTSTAIAIRDAVVGIVQAWWTPSAPDTVQAVYLPDSESPNKLPGRRVMVANDPVMVTQPGGATRDSDIYDYPIYVAVVEPYKGAGNPPVAWIDERVQFFETLLKLLGEARKGEDGAALFTGDLAAVYPNEAESIVAFDLDELRENKLYWGMFAVTYRAHE